MELIRVTYSFTASYNDYIPGIVYFIYSNIIYILEQENASDLAVKEKQIECYTHTIPMLSTKFGASDLPHNNA